MREFNQPEEQAGFRRGFATVDHIHTINQIIEKTKEFNLKVGFLFIDFNKAFDSVSHSSMIGALHKQGIPYEYIFE